MILDDPISIESLWTAIRKTLRREIGDASYQSWIGVLDVDDVHDGVVRLAAPNRFICNKVSDRFGDRLAALWREADGRIVSVEFIVAQASAVRVAAVGGGGGVRLSSPSRLTLRAADEPPEPLSAPGSGLDPRNKFDAFVVGSSNELAHAAARRVAEADGPAASFNPLFLYGGVGLGKTHLMHAIAWEAQQRSPEKTVLYVSAEKFMHRFVSALRHKDVFAFKDEFRSVDMLLVDDFQFIAGKEQTQEEFFHTFNALIDQNRQIVISADRSPSDLEGVEERIRSRLNWGLVADIGPTDYELRLGVLQTKAEAAIQANPGLQFGVRVLEFIAHRIVSNVRDLEGALNRLVAHATLVGRPITVEVAQETLQDLVRRFDRRITIEEIQRKVAEHYNIKLSDMLSPRRARSVARPRQIAMYLAKDLTDKSLPEIGRKFGKRDHTTVMHAVKRIAQLRAEDSSLDEDVTMLGRTLQF